RLSGDEVRADPAHRDAAAEAPRPDDVTAVVEELDHAVASLAAPEQVVLVPPPEVGADAHAALEPDVRAADPARELEHPVVAAAPAPLVDLHGRLEPDALAEAAAGRGRDRRQDRGAGLRGVEQAHVEVEPADGRHQKLRSGCSRISSRSCMRTTCNRIT